MLSIARDLECQGFAFLRGVFDSGDTQLIAKELERAGAADDRAVRRCRQQIYALRDVLRLCPPVVEWWRKPMLVNLVRGVLGSGSGLVRAILFDKPAAQTWAVPFHKDLTIAIQPPAESSALYSAARLKAGVWHCEPPLSVLEQMLTLRIHLDAATEANGALVVRPGTHRGGKELSAETQTPAIILAEPGDVLMMRPLLEHASSKSRPGGAARRRVLHLEFAASPRLPDGYRWHEFQPVA